MTHEAHTCSTQMHYTLLMASTVHTETDPTILLWVADIYVDMLRPDSQPLTYFEAGQPFLTHFKAGFQLHAGACAGARAVNRDVRAHFYVYIISNQARALCTCGFQGYCVTALDCNC